MNELKARFTKNGNIKLGNMWVFSKLKGAKTYATKYGNVKGTCGGYCAYCETACYVEKSYVRWTDKNGNNQVINSHARNTIAFRNDLEKAFTDLNNQIVRAKKKPQYIRIDQSGEIETPMELLLWIKTAEKNPDQLFYCYTKNVDAIRMVINTYKADNKNIPSNITVLVSVWHDYLLAEYLNEFAQYDFIKAFVYDDGAFNYADNGLEIETYCMAYDQNGKMDHRITCDLCHKCINSPYKVIGCYDH